MEKTSGKVLVLFRETDFQAFSKPDHEQIVYTVNHFETGASGLISFPETEHYFAKSGTMQNAFDLFSNGKIQKLFELFNMEVIVKSLECSKKQLNMI